MADEDRREESSAPAPIPCDRSSETSTTSATSLDGERPTLEKLPAAVKYPLLASLLAKVRENCSGSDSSPVAPILDFKLPETEECSPPPDYETAKTCPSLPSKATQVFANACSEAIEVPESICRPTADVKEDRTSQSINFPEIPLRETPEDQGELMVQRPLVTIVEDRSQCIEILESASEEQKEWTHGRFPMTLQDYLKNPVKIICPSMASQPINDQEGACKEETVKEDTKLAATALGLHVMIEEGGEDGKDGEYGARVFQTICPRCSTGTRNDGAKRSLQDADEKIPPALVSENSSSMIQQWLERRKAKRDNPYDGQEDEPPMQFTGLGDVGFEFNTDCDIKKWNSCGISPECVPQWLQPVAEEIQKVDEERMQCTENLHKFDKINVALAEQMAQCDEERTKLRGQSAQTNEGRARFVREAKRAIWAFEWKADDLKKENECMKENIQSRSDVFGRHALKLSNGMEKCMEVIENSIRKYENLQNTAYELAMKEMTAAESKEETLILAIHLAVRIELEHKLLGELDGELLEQVSQLKEDLVVCRLEMMVGKEEEKKEAMVCEQQAQKMRVTKKILSNLKTKVSILTMKLEDLQKEPIFNRSAEFKTQSSIPSHLQKFFEERKQLKMPVVLDNMRAKQSEATWEAIAALHEERYNNYWNVRLQPGRFHFRNSQLSKEQKELELENMKLKREQDEVKEENEMLVQAVWESVHKASDLEAQVAALTIKNKHVQFLTAENDAVHGRNAALRKKLEECQSEMVAWSMGAKNGVDACAQRVKEVMESAKTVKNLHKEVAAQRAEHEISLNTEIAELKRENEMMKNEITELQHQNSSLVTKLEKRAEDNTTDEEREECKRKNQIVKEHILMLRAEVAALKRVNETMKNEMTELQNQNSKPAIKLGKSAYENATAEEREVCDKVKQKSTFITGLTTQISALKRENETITNVMAKFQNQNSSLVAKLKKRAEDKTTDEEREECKRKMQKVNEFITSLKTEIAALKRENEGMTKQSADLITQNSQLSTSLEERLQDTKATDTRRTEYVTQMIKVKTRYSNLETENEELKKLNEKLQKDNEDMRKYMDELLQKQCNALKMKNESMQTSLEQCAETYEDLQKRCEALKVKNESIQNMNDQIDKLVNPKLTLATNLENCVEQNYRLQERCEDLNMENKCTRERMDSQIAKLTKQNKALEANLENCSEEKEQLQVRCKVLKWENEKLKNADEMRATLNAEVVANQTQALRESENKVKELEQKIVALEKEKCDLEVEMKSVKSDLLERSVEPATELARENPTQDLGETSQPSTQQPDEPVTTTDEFYDLLHIYVDQIAELSKQSDTLTSEIATMKTQRQELADELKRTADSNEELKIALDMVMQENQELRETVKDFENSTFELQQIDDKYRTLREKKEHVEHQLNRHFERQMEDLEKILMKMTDMCSPGSKQAIISSTLKTIYYEKVVASYVAAAGKDVATDDVVTDDVATDDVVTDDVATDDVVMDDVVTDDVAADDAATYDIFTDCIAADYVAPYDVVPDFEKYIGR